MKNYKLDLPNEACVYARVAIDAETPETMASRQIGSADRETVHQPIRGSKCYE